MGYRYLDMDSYKRKSHFAYFNSLAYPYVGITVNVDMLGLAKSVKANRLPLFLTVCYLVGKAANEVPEFRQRIEQDKIIEFDRCRTSHTVALEDGTYCYCTLDGDMSFADFIPYAVKEQEEAIRRRTIEEEKEDTRDLFFISTVPWVSYTSLIQPVPMPADSNPRITWGKFFFMDNKTLLPVTVLCHHALVDGIHIARFYQSLEGQILEMEKRFQDVSV